MVDIVIPMKKADLLYHHILPNDTASISDISFLCERTSPDKLSSLKYDI